MLRRTIIRSAVGLALSLTILATRASAQTTSGTTLDKANMQQFFANMGYDIQKLGDAQYSFTTHPGNYTVTITAGISSNGQFLWLSSMLATLPDTGPLPADLLEAALKANDDIGPAALYIRVCSDCAAGSKRQLRMATPLANHQLTPAIVRRSIEAITQSISDTSQVWASAGWNPTAVKK
jgi:hypothetical protein